MGYLVYCPTCNGKMSSNAECCPHCGETHFYKREHYSKKIQCDTCNGSGKIISYKDSVCVKCVGDEIVGVEARVIDVGSEMNGNGEVIDKYILKEHPNISEIISCIKKHQYKINHCCYDQPWRGALVKPISANYRNSGYGHSNAYLSYNKEIHKCHNCNGIGYFTDNSDYRLRDMRKRVEQPIPKNNEDEFDRLLDEFLKENFG